MGKEWPIGQWALWTLAGVVTFSFMPPRARVPFVAIVLLGALASMELRRRGSSREFIEKTTGIDI